MLREVHISILLMLSFSILFPIQFVQADVRYEVQVKPETSKDRIWLNMQFYNDSPNDIAIPFWGLAKYSQFFHFDIKGPDGRILAQPLPEKFSDPLPAGQHLSSSIPQIANSPFAIVKPYEKIEYDIVLGSIPGRNVQKYYFRQPGQYTINAEYVNPFSTYVDLETHEVEKVGIAFVGSVKASPVKVTLTDKEKDAQFTNTGLYAPPWHNEQRQLTSENVLDFIAGVETGTDINQKENIESNEGLTITGEVFDEEGEPVANAVLEVTAYLDKQKDVMYGSSGRFITRDIDRQRSGLDGKYKFTNLPQDANSFRIVVDHEDNYIESHIVVSNRDKISKSNINIIMKEGDILRGKVVDEKGNPIPGTRITNYSHIVYGDQLLLERYHDLHSGSNNRHVVYANKNGEFEINCIERMNCQFFCKGFKPEYFSPDEGHENDGTWIEVLQLEQD